MIRLCWVSVKVYAGCIQVAGAYECSCSPGYEQQGDGTTGDCIEIDECETRVHNCDVGALIPL